MDSPSPDPAGTTGSTHTTPFRDRACFIAGPARSGTTLLTALLDGHPELLVLPEETAYFPTVLGKFARRGRREQVDYLVNHSLSNVVFGGPCKWGQRDYSHFPAAELRQSFEARALDPANARRDLLVLLLETYADTLGQPLDAVRRWVEKTPANRNHLTAIFKRFPRARVFLTIRDPRALLASQIDLERRRQLHRFSAYMVVRHWRTVAETTLRHRQNPGTEKHRLMLVNYRRMIEEPETLMRKVSAFLNIAYDPALLTPTKMGRPWAGNSSAGQTFHALSTEPINRWQKLLSETEIGWIEWHCRDLMEQLGYEPMFSRRRLGHWFKPVRGETPKEYLKSRFYSLRRR